MFDTNIYISALINPLGIPSQCLIYAGEYCKIYICDEIITELKVTGSREYFRRYFTLETLNELINSLEERTVMAYPDNYILVPGINPSLLNDYIINSAFQNSHADYLVTGNIKDFPKSSNILSPREFLDLVT